MKWEPNKYEVGPFSRTQGGACREEDGMHGQMDMSMEDIDGLLYHTTDTGVVNIVARLSTRRASYDLNNTDSRTLYVF